jgi:hypothetical protein
MGSNYSSHLQKVTSDQPVFTGPYMMNL